MEQRVAGADHAREAGLGEAEVGEEFDAVLGRHRRDFGLDRRRHHDRLRALGLGLIEHPRRQRIALGSGRLLDVADVEHGLAGQQLRLVEPGDLLGIARPPQPRRLARAQQLEHGREHAELRLRLLVALLRLLAEIGDAALEALEVGEHQLGLDGLGVGDRIDLALDMGDVAILEAAQHMDDRVDFADVGEELVAEPFALRRAAHQAGDVDEAELSLDDLGGAGDAREIVGARIGTATWPTLGSIVQKG